LDDNPDGDCAAGPSLLRGPVGFELRHFQNCAQRIEAVAPGHLGEFARERGNIMCGGFGSFSPIRIVRIVPVRHFLFATQFLGALPRSPGALAEFADMAMC
jgi:hypothetical protein